MREPVDWADICSLRLRLRHHWSLTNTDVDANASVNKPLWSLRLINRVATRQGNVKEKQNFLQVREKLGNFEKMSGNFGHFTHVLSWNFVMSCQGIVGEFYHDIIFDWNLHHMIRLYLGCVYVNVCLANINSRFTDYYCSFAFQKSWVCGGIAINNSWKLFLTDWKIKEIVREFWMDSNVATLIKCHAFECQRFLLFWHELNLQSPA